MLIITNFNTNILTKEKIEEVDVSPLKKRVFDKLICECNCPTEEIKSSEIKSLFEETNDNK